MKIAATITTRITFTFLDPRVTEEVARDAAIALEAGWRVGAKKDLEMLQAVYRDQFHRQARVTLDDVHFDVTLSQ